MTTASQHGLAKITTAVRIGIYDVNLAHNVERACTGKAPVVERGMWDHAHLTNPLALSNGGHVFKSFQATPHFFIRFMSSLRRLASRITHMWRASFEAVQNTNVSSFMSLRRLAKVNVARLTR